MSTSFAAIAWRYGQAFDQAVWAKLGSIRQRWQSPQARERELLAEISWAQLLQGTLRSGLSLEHALAETRKLPLFGETSLQADWSRLQSGQVPSSSVGLVIHLGRSRGGALGESLKAAKRGLQAKLRAQRKLRSGTSQARTQIAIAALMPLLLLFATAIVAPDLLRESLQEPLSWLLLIAAALFSFAGWSWCKRLQSRAFSLPDKLEQECFDHLDGYLLRVLIAMGAGTDVESAFMEQIAYFPPQSLLRQRLSHRTAPSSECPAILKQIFSLRDRAKRFGSPIRQELLEIIGEMENQRENHWEEASQILPLKLLAPMFLCVFPANLLAILFPFLPLLRSF